MSALELRSAPGLVAALALFSPLAIAADFYVAPSGNDTAAGTRSSPFATLAAARDAARQAGTGPHRIVLLSGDYFLEKTLEFDTRDNGLTVEASELGKATLYGGRLVTGWHPDGDRFWSADLPQVKAGVWDFRALVVDGRMPDRARLPETGTLLHLSKFDVPWLSSVAGGWARKPTPDELKTLLYDPKDIPATLDVRNAEVRVYHMWDESLVGVAANDAATHQLTFSTPSQSPPGAFGVKKYVVFNTREGMTRPGQWYLDRTAGRVVYWPLPGQDMTKARVIAPVLERIISVTGNSRTPVEKLTLRGFRMQATTTPLKPAGFSAGAYDGALRIEWAHQCLVEKLEIANAGGQGILARDLNDCEIRDSEIHHIGACGIRTTGTRSRIVRNHLHHIGVYHPSAVPLSAGHITRVADDKGFHIYRNEIHDAPYSGIIGSGSGHLIEENIIYQVMREMQDGGAIYGGIKNSILRGNMVRDVVKMGEGYGVSAYYLDEGAENCIVERNVSIGVERPTHNHIARNLTIRDNVFIADANMTLSFQRSGDCIFTGNTLFVPGKITINQPNAIKQWTGNIVFREGRGNTGTPQPFTIDDAMPPTPPPARRTAPVVITRIARPPVVDGEIGWDEYPSAMVNLDRDPQRGGASGAPVFTRMTFDDRFLYIAFNVAMFDITKLRIGSQWGQDDGAEISIASKTGTVIIRGFAGGTVECQGPGADALRSTVQFTAKRFGTAMGGWRGEFAIPLEAPGLNPAPGTKVAFNLDIFRAEDKVQRCLEGTLAENWRVEQAAILQFK